ncbi:MAG: hypothetical protein P4L55_18595 [Syntrophobacteraceae bacterium]|nr:hypothetical protein [Syntrophobacteraceae bacterium]
MTDNRNSAAHFFPDIFPPRRIRVLGAGRFGNLAVQRIKPRFPDALLTVCDRDPVRVAQISGELGVAAEVGECISSIGKAEPDDDLWFIPSVPVHVGFEWVLSELERRGSVHRLAVPEGVDRQVPNALRVASGAVYASFATFLCPDCCNEPEEICTHTGKKRPGNLYDVLGGVRVPGFEALVLRSWQLAPGVGGYPGRSLRQLAARIGAGPGAWLVATSCRCHAVINALEWSGS